MAYLGNNPTQQAFQPAIDYFSGNGATSSFTLSRPVASVAQVQVVVNNVQQNPSSFTVSGNTLTLGGAPSAGTNNIYVYYTSPITQIMQPGQGTVGITALNASGTPDATTYLRGDNSWAIAGFPAGTLMLFQQTAAPTGWTKQTTHDNKALRVVSGTAGSGGSVSFTSAFASQTPSGSINLSGWSVGATTLSTAQMPSHSHEPPYWDWAVSGTNSPKNSWAQGKSQNGGGSSGMSTTSNGGGGSHSHSISGSATFTGSAINLAVQYVDLIIAAKD